MPQAKTIVPLNPALEQPTRRALLGMTAALAAVGVAGAAPAMAAEDPHHEWLKESARLIDLINGPAPEGLTIEQEDDLISWQSDRYGGLFDQIAETPARTLAGVQAQLAVALYCAETWEGARNEPVVRALQNAARSLDRLAGRA